jgi:NAD(P)-dependent dehydrogenase (short-subunit alcohol dehydrogenase family)
MAKLDGRVALVTGGARGSEFCVDGGILAAISVGA